MPHTILSLPPSLTLSVFLSCSPLFPLHLDISLPPSPSFTLSLSASSLPHLSFSLSLPSSLLLPLPPSLGTEMITDSQIESGLLKADLKDQVMYTLLRKHRHQTKKSNLRSLADIGKTVSSASRLFSNPDNGKAEASLVQSSYFSFIHAFFSFVIYSYSHHFQNFPFPSSWKITRYALVFFYVEVVVFTDFFYRCPD